MGRRKPPKSPAVHRLSGYVPFDARPIEPISRLPGGLPPEPNRTPWRRMSDTGRVAREPFASKEVKGEYFATKKYLA